LHVCALAFAEQKTNGGYLGFSINVAHECYIGTTTCTMDADEVGVALDDVDRCTQSTQPCVKVIATKDLSQRLD
jgi:hypothetical protein